MFFDPFVESSHRYRICVRELDFFPIGQVFEVKIDRFAQFFGQKFQSYRLLFSEFRKRVAFDEFRQPDRDGSSNPRRIYEYRHHKAISPRFFVDDP